MIRLIDTGPDAAPFNMALDEALLLHAGRGPTLRFYGWDPPSVSIGYFQGVREEVNVEKCKELGVPVVRRMTGGGAVFHENELTYSFVTRDFPQDVMGSYRKICGAVIRGLRSVGVKAAFSSLNDLTINGKKVSGNAQTRKSGALLQHGTLLLGVDLEKMFSLLKVPEEKLRDKAIKDAGERVAPLGLGLGEAKEALKAGFGKVFGEPVEGKVSGEELALARKLEKEKYSKKEWTFKR